MNAKEAAEAAIATYDAPPQAGVGTEAPNGSPLSTLAREAICWAAETGYVEEMDVPGLGKFKLRPSPRSPLPAPRPNGPAALPKLVDGKWDEAILFGAVTDEDNNYPAHIPGMTGD